MAKLYFYYSTMNAGKSTALLQAAYNYAERGMRTMLFTARARRPGRRPHRLAHRHRRRRPALRRRHRLLGRLPADPARTASWSTRPSSSPRSRSGSSPASWTRPNIPVMCYGLRTDFRGELFPGSAALLAWADTLVELKTICCCGRKATMVVRVSPDGTVERAGRAGRDRRQRALRAAVPPAFRRRPPHRHLPRRTGGGNRLSTSRQSIFSMIGAESSTPGRLL